MRGPWTVGRREVALAAVVGLLAAVEVVTAPLGPHRPLAALCLLTAAASLTWRVRAPLVPTAVIAATAPLLPLLGVPSNATLTLLAVLVIAGYSLAAHARGPQAMAGLAGLAAAATLAVLLDHRGLAANLPFALLLVSAPFGMGLAMRTRQDRLHAAQEHAALAEERARWAARQAELAAAAALAEERARIARELHDVVAHSLTVIGLQAGGVRRRLLPDQSTERDALALVERTSRQAQDEMRHLLALLRAGEQESSLVPQPGLARLPELVADAESGGLRVLLHRDGDLSALPPGVDLTAYRIVQESLTNCRKHSTASCVRIDLRVAPGRLGIEIVDNGEPTGQAGGGFGLVGMRERAALYDGELHAGPVAGGGFRIATTLRFREGSA